MRLVITVSNTTFTFTNNKGRPKKGRKENHFDNVIISKKRGRPVGSKNKTAKTTVENTVNKRDKAARVETLKAMLYNSRWAAKQNKEINKNVQDKLARIETLNSMMVQG
jgi:hypothetical protein